MSRLTNCQIEAVIRGLESSLARADRRGDGQATKRRQQLLDNYRGELADRQAAEPPNEDFMPAEEVD